MQKNNKKLDEEKQFGKTYVAKVSTKIGLNFVFSVSFCSLMKCSLSKWKFYHEYHFFTDLFGRCGELTGAGGD